MAHRMREILSTARPTPLRLAGFLALTPGAAGAGLGAVRDWVVVGFPGDATRAADVPVSGTDVWEGKAVLLLAVATLVGMLAIRLAAASSTRTAIAVVLIAFGAVAAALPPVVAAGAEQRFGGGEGLDRIARALALELALPEDVVREQLEEQFGALLRVDVASGVWISAAGGALIALGGGLSLAWALRRSGPRSGVAPRAPAATEGAPGP